MDFRITFSWGRGNIIRMPEGTIRSFVDQRCGPMQRYIFPQRILLSFVIYGLVQQGQYFWFSWILYGVMSLCLINGIWTKLIYFKSSSSLMLVSMATLEATYWRWLNIHCSWLQIKLCCVYPLKFGDSSILEAVITISVPNP